MTVDGKFLGDLDPGAVPGASTQDIPPLLRLLQGAGGGRDRNPAETSGMSSAGAK